MTQEKAIEVSSIMPENAFSLEDIFLSSFQILKIYLRALVRRLDTPR